MNTQERINNNLFIFPFKQRKKVFSNIIIKQIMDPEQQPKASGEQAGSPPLPTNLQGEVTNGGKKYNVELTVSQANAIMKILPPCYSLLTERQVKNKRNNNKKKNPNKKDISNCVQPLDQLSPSLKKKTSTGKFNENVHAQISCNQPAQYYEESDDTLKPCAKILHLLKLHKTSWPFRDPVDPITLGVPNYFEIIKEPMDLTTIDNNLKTNAYVSQTQFHADINKIISNSFLFNKNNPDFLKLTEEFQAYYSKIMNDASIHRTPLTSFSTKATFTQKNKKSKPSQKQEQKYREPNESHAVTLAEKKTLAMQLKHLPKEYLLGVANIVYEGQPPQEELNIENLQPTKIRQLQRYVQEKMVLAQQKNQAEKQALQDNHDDQSEESSFESDSDS